MVIEIQSDSDIWSKVKHALRAAGYKYYLQQNLFDANRTTLFLEPIPEPEGGELNRGFIVYPGGCLIGSTIQEVYDQEIGIPLQEKPAVKSSTNVAAASTVCSSCGCRVGPGMRNTRKCTCRCHGADRGDTPA